MASDPPIQVKATVLREGACHDDLSIEDAIKAFRDPKLVTWLHITYLDKDKAADFLHSLGFHILAVEDALNEDERPSLHEYDDNFFLSAWKVISKGEDERYVEVGFFVTKSSLVTVCAEPLPMVDSWVDRWKKSPDRIGGTPVDLMHSVIDNIVDEYYTVADEMEDQVDELIDNIYHGDNQQIRKILLIKRRLIEMRRHINPVRDIMNSLLRRDMILVPPASRAYLQDVYDHTLRLSELTDINRETLTSALDVHLSTVSNNLNTVMKKMTVISTVLMSAALIAGIYGMNFHFMPELSWFWGYPFALILMFASGIGILILFKWKNWL
jgi:magnesium transporter